MGSEKKIGKTPISVPVQSSNPYRRLQQTGLYTQERGERKTLEGDVLFWNFSSRIKYPFEHLSLLLL